MVDRLVASDAARALLAQITREHGPVMFFQSGGCCDGSAPMCHPVGSFHTGPNDLHLGTIDGAEFWISAVQYDAWKHTQVILDAGPGSGAGFSLDNGRTTRFLSDARVFTNDELAQLDTLTTAQPKHPK